MASWAKRKAAVRKYKSKRYGKKRMVNVNRALTPFAQRYITKMKYSQVFSLTSTSPQYAFRLNSIFDPDFTGTGHQPYGHDTLNAVYNRYRVISCSYNITAYAGGSVLRVAALPANDLMPPSSVSDICENPRSKWIIQIPGGNTKLLKGKVYIPSLMGRNKQQYLADDRFQAAFGTNPLEAAILNVVGADISDNGTTISCTITMNYVVECFDPRNLAQS